MVAADGGLYRRMWTRVREEAIAWLNAAFEAKSAKKSKKGCKSNETIEGQATARLVDEGAGDADA